MKSKGAAIARTVAFKATIGGLSAIVIGLLLSQLAETIIDRPYRNLRFEVSRPDFRLVLSSRSGAPLSDNTVGLRLSVDPYTVYRNLPLQTTPSYVINQDGFRTDDSDHLSPDVFVLGGSAAFGQGLKPGERPFSAILDSENRLVGIWNSAVVGYVSGQELATMIHYLDSFHPSLYIVFDGWNDLFSPWAHFELRPPSRALIGGQGIFSQIETRLLDARPVDSIQSRGLRDYKRNTLFAEMDEESFYAEITGTYIQNLSRMNDFAHARGADLLVVFQPELGHKKHPAFKEKASLTWWNRKFGYLHRDFPGRYDAMLKIATERCDELAIPYLNLLLLPEIVDSPEPLFSDVVHLNQRGHELVAGAISEHMNWSDSR